MADSAENQALIVRTNQPHGSSVQSYFIEYADQSSLRKAGQLEVVRHRPDLNGGVEIDWFLWEGRSTRYSDPTLRSVATSQLCYSR